MPATEPIRKKSDLSRLASYFLSKGELRNHVMVILGSCTALRISDLLRLKLNDVYDFGEKKLNSHIILKEQKTGKIKTIAINDAARKAFMKYFPKRKGHFIFSNGRKKRSSDQPGSGLVDSPRGSEAAQHLRPYLLP